MEELRGTLDEMREGGIENVLALRGDPPQGQTEWTQTPGGLQYSTELAELIAEQLRLRDRRRLLPGGASRGARHATTTSAS